MRSNVSLHVDTTAHLLLAQRFYQVATTTTYVVFLLIKQRTISPFPVGRILRHLNTTRRSVSR